MTRLLLAVAAFALVAAGCGAAESDSNLAAAAAKTEGAGSSRFAISGEEGADRERPKIGCKGEADYAAKRVRLSCDYGSQGRMELIGIATETYMRGDVFGFGGDADKWVRSTDDDNIGEELSPQSLLTLLRDASESTERLGEDDVRGVDTVGYRLVVECEQAKLTDCEGETAPVAVWIDDEGFVRRIAVTEGVVSPFTFEFFDFGAEVSIEAPAADDVVEVGQLAQPQPCRMTEGSPLTGTQVSAALRRHGLAVSGVDECVGDAVSVFTSPTPASNSAGFLHCTVSRHLGASPLSGIDGTGLRSATVGNVDCVYSDDLASRMEPAIAELEREIHP
jgi:hypothetical protein